MLQPGKHRRESDKYPNNDYDSCTGVWWWYAYDPHTGYSFGLSDPDGWEGLTGDREWGIGIYWNYDSFMDPVGQLTFAEKDGEKALLLWRLITSIPADAVEDVVVAATGLARK